MSKIKNYWKGIEEKENTPAFIKQKEKEFSDFIPVEEIIGKQSKNSANTPRRDFLKFLGFSVTAATMAACEAPVQKAIPYVIKPEEVTPGVANWYASSYFDGTDYCSVIVKTREGRPIKIEGNKLSKVTNGATNARVQASVLSLYDKARLRNPYKDKKETTWSAVDKDIKDALTGLAATNGNIVVLTSTVCSPSTKKVIADFIAKYPTAKHISYDAVSYSGMLDANQQCFGQRILPVYHFENANCIVSFGADFLTNWVSPIEHAVQYGKARKLDNRNKIAQHIQFEANLTVSGSNADYRYPTKVSELDTALAYLYNLLAKKEGGATLKVAALDENVKKGVEKTAERLWANRGKSLVVSGSNSVATQTVVNAINYLLANYGTTIDMNNASMVKQGNDSEVAQLVKDMNAGTVGALFMYNVNPAYTYPKSAEFTNGLKKVKLSVSFSDKMDETASLCHYICPDHHYLESWNDLNPQSGHYSLSQPVIKNLFNTRSAQESLLKWTGNDQDYHTYVKANWQATMFGKQNMELFFDSFWNHCLQDGVFIVESETRPSEGSVALATTLDLQTAGTQIEKAAQGKGNFELALYEKTGLGNGSHANNPWLQELPDPITKIVWDNYVTMSPYDMDKKKNPDALGLNVLLGQEEEINMVKVTANGYSVTLPVVAVPGQKPGTIGIAVGYGRTKDIGKVAEATGGANAYPFASVVNGSIQYTALNASVEKVEETYSLASTQTSHTLMGREIVKETTLEEYIKNPKAGNEPEEIAVSHDLSESGKMAPEKVNLWEDHPRDGNFWNMSIDLSSCIGCGACVIGCTSENNVPVVGKDEVRRTREMHWLRIDRYYSSDTAKDTEEYGAIKKYAKMEEPSMADTLGVVFQPMLCQHCNHAPCETVCPVAATSHSTDGLNQMAYNRCIGTRYCANNCPYKVRRFNWFNYITNDKFAAVNPGQQDEFSRMVLNPDVVVRSRGVMEKCTMCVQRIQSGVLEAKKQHRKLKDGEIQTACSQACPTNAITFGNVNDKSSDVAIKKEDPRKYYVLREYNTQPSVFYLTKVRNKA